MPCKVGDTLTLLDASKYPATAREVAREICAGKPVSGCTVKASPLTTSPEDRHQQQTCRAELNIRGYTGTSGTCGAGDIGVLHGAARYPLAARWAARRICDPAQPVTVDETAGTIACTLEDTAP